MMYYPLEKLMIKLVTTISYNKYDSVPPKMAEVFIYSSLKRNAILIEINSQGFKHPILLLDVTSLNINGDIDDYLIRMFGYEEYYLIFKLHPDIYIYERRQGKRLNTIHSINWMNDEVNNFIRQNTDCFN